MACFHTNNVTCANCRHLFEPPAKLEILQKKLGRKWQIDADEANGDIIVSRKSEGKSPSQEHLRVSCEFVEDHHVADIFAAICMHFQVVE